jgi:hypothetical protein
MVGEREGKGYYCEVDCCRLHLVSLAKPWAGQGVETPEQAFVISMNILSYRFSVIRRQRMLSFREVSEK